MKPLRSRSGKRGPTPKVSKKGAQPDEISGAVSFLSDGTESSFATGQVLSVADGFASAALLHQHWDARFTM
jgi:NAD(P)-dependent dehydrogenase (short-subunit alcohol dehydrogenase family)